MLALPAKATGILAALQLQVPYLDLFILNFEAVIFLVIFSNYYLTID